MPEKYEILHEQDPDLPKIRLFTLFLRADKRIEHSYEWSMSIESKITVVGIMFNEVIEQLPRCLEEFELNDERRVERGVECPKLALKYETFANSIYHLCENLSRIVAYLYPKASLPPGFNKQKKRFHKKPEIDSIYAGILNKFAKTYEEIHSIRSESTHYLSGFITLSGPTELGYFNNVKSKRTGGSEKISIDSIGKHIEKVYDDVLEFVDSFGNHFINFIPKDSPITLLCLITTSGRIGFKNISLGEYLNGEQGVCYTPEMDCPLKESCMAYKTYIDKMSNNK